MQTHLNRRIFLKATAAASLLPLAPSQADDAPAFRVHSWQKHPRNPVLPPGGMANDVGCCMNPFVLRRDNEYWLYYAGADKGGRRRICLATTAVDNLTAWKRQGPLFELGGRGSFDEIWCVLPCVHRVGEQWHMYYSGRSALAGVGLQAFWGIGLAVSNDLRTWKKVSDEPILRGDGFAEWPKNRGVAGGGRIIEIPPVADAPGSPRRYRMYYTLCPGTPSKDLLVDQAKYSVIAHSEDGRTWTDKRVVLRPRRDVPYENAATIALNVWRTRTRWRAIYAGIGTRFGAYSICEAVSDDGLTWERGKPGQNLALPPAGNGWESRMTEYPNIIEEEGKLRLFYCGNGYGATGIGTALADKID